MIFRNLAEITLKSCGLNFPLQCKACVVVAILSLLVSGCISSTEYASGYSEEVFDSVRIGDRAEHVREQLGVPLRSKLKEFPTSHWYDSKGGYITVLDQSRVESASSNLGAAVMNANGDRISLEKLIGPPDRIVLPTTVEMLGYTVSPSGGNFFQRDIYIDAKTGIVIGKVKCLYID
jgi:hypothetical protein